MGTSREGSIRAPRLTCHGRNIGPLQMDILSVMGANSIPIESELQWALVPCAFRFWCLSACQCWGTRDAGSPFSGPPHRRRPARALCESDLYRSEVHTSELQSLIRTSYAVFFLKKKHKHRILST